MGNYYELAFRDLYPAPPLTDCQHTSKFLVADSNGTEYDETFRFSVFEADPTNHSIIDELPLASLINHKDTTVAEVVDQTITEVWAYNYSFPPIPLRDTTFHTTDA